MKVNMEEVINYVTLELRKKEIEKQEEGKEKNVKYFSVTKLMLHVGVSKLLESIRKHKILTFLVAAILVWFFKSETAKRILAFIVEL